MMKNKMVRPSSTNLKTSMLKRKSERVWMIIKYIVITLIYWLSDEHSDTNDGHAAGEDAEFNLPSVIGSSGINKPSEGKETIDPPRAVDVTEEPPDVLGFGHYGDLASSRVVVSCVA